MTKEVTAYTSIQSKMMDLMATEAPPTSTAYYSKAQGRPPTSPQRRLQPSTSTPPGSQHQCTYYRKRGYTHVGHDWTSCARLKADKTQRSNSRDTRKRTRETAYGAEVSEDEVIEDTCFAVDCNGIPVQPEEAVTSNFLDAAPSSSCPSETIDLGITDDTWANLATEKTTQVPWIFDTGCTRHITWRKADFMTLVPWNSRVRVAGGKLYPALGKGSVRIPFVTPKGQVVPGILQDVLWVPHLRFARLFSWWQVASRFRLSGAGDNVFLSRQGRVYLWARSTARGLAIQLERRHDAALGVTA